MSNGIFDILSPDGAPIFVASLPNPGVDGVKHHQYIRSERELQRFIARADHRGRALYFSVSRLQDGARTRSKATVKDCYFLFSEIDFENHPETAPEEILRRIQTCPHPPTIVISSGHGYHVYWQFKEPVSTIAGPAQAEFEETLKLACTYLGGDRQATEAARLLRLPGSHNSKMATCCR